MKRLDGKDTPKRNNDSDIMDDLDGEKEEKCKECEKIFEKEEALIQHRREEHGSTCLKCFHPCGTRKMFEKHRVLE